MNYKLDEVCDFYNGGAWSDKEYVSDGLPVLKVKSLWSILKKLQKGFICHRTSSWKIKI